MCMGFVRKGEDLIFGYNLDLAVGAWDYKVYAKDGMFYIGIKVGSRLYKTHGVNKNGNFADLPYMNDPSCGTYRRGRNYQRIDLLVDGYISGRYTYDDLLDILARREIVNVQNASMHSLIADGGGRMMLVEPGLGYREIAEDYAVISNFPLLEEVPDLSAAWYGKERYDRGLAMLNESDASFSAADGLRLLRECRQEGEWATRVSFVYSRRDNAVSCVRDNDFDHVVKHTFK